MKKLLVFAVLLASCREDVHQVLADVTPPNVVRAPAIDAGAPSHAQAKPPGSAESWEKIHDAITDHVRLQTLETLLLYTERSGAPVVIISAAPKKYDEAPQLRVRVQYPGCRQVTVDHYVLSSALADALMAGLDGCEPRTKR